MRQLTRIVNKWKHSEGEDWSVIGKNGKIVAPQRVPVVFFTPVEVGGFEKFNMIKVCKQIAGIVKGGIGEPKLTRNGYLMIAAESEEGRASLLKIAKLGALPVKAEESKRTTVLKGKIIGVHPSITVETVKETLERQGVAEVARLKYRDHQYGYLKNTDQVILTFAGTTAPDSVILGMKQPKLFYIGNRSSATNVMSSGTKVFTVKSGVRGVDGVEKKDIWEKIVNQKSLAV